MCGPRDRLRANARLVFACLVIAAGCGGSSTVRPLAERPQTAPRCESALRAERVSAGALRRTLGLRSESEWIDEVRQSPESVFNLFYGLQLAPDEQAELAALEGRLSAAAQRLLPYADQHPQQFGGLYIDSSRGAVVVLFTSGLDAHATAIRQLVPDVRVDVQACRYSLAELSSFMQSFDADVLRAEGYEVFEYGVDVLHNAVRIKARTDLPDAARRIEARFGDKVRAEIYPKHMLQSDLGPAPD